MALSLSHNIANGTEPDAEEVMANFNDLLERANNTAIVGETSSSTVSLSNGVGSTNSTIASKTFDVAESSSFLVGVQGSILTWNRTGVLIGVMQLLVDGSAAITQTYSEDANYGNDTSKTNPLAGLKVVGLTAGSHTVAVKYTLTCSEATGTLAANAMQAAGASWGGLVMPV